MVLSSTHLPVQRISETPAPWTSSKQPHEPREPWRPSSGMGGASADSDCSIRKAMVLFASTRYITPHSKFLSSCQTGLHHKCSHTMVQGFYIHSPQSSVLIPGSEQMPRTTLLTRPLLVRPSKTQRLPPSRRIRIKHRLLRKTSHPRPMPWFEPLVVIRSIVHRDSATIKSQLPASNQQGLSNSQLTYYPKAHSTPVSN